MRIFAIGIMSASFLFYTHMSVAAETDVPESQNWQNSAQFQNWDQCGADYTPPEWCEALPKDIAVDQSYTSNRENLMVGKKAATERLLKAAKILENRVGAARNIQEGTLYKQDLMTITKQAQFGDLESMELLAWMYVKGMMPKSASNIEPNEAAYIWYGKAYLAGAKDAKVNMDKIWPSLSVTEQRRITKYFDRK